MRSAVGRGTFLALRRIIPRPKPELRVRLACIQGFRGKPLDGGNERAIEGHALSEVTDNGTLKSVHHTVENRTAGWESPETV